MKENLNPVPFRTSEKLLIDGMNLLYCYERGAELLRRKKIRHAIEDLIARIRLLQTSTRGSGSVPRGSNASRSATRRASASVARGSSANGFSKSVRLFIDGKKATYDDCMEENLGSIQVIYSHEKSADDLIQETIREHPQPQTLTIVTNDRALSAYARNRNCRTRRADELASLIESHAHNHSHNHADHSAGPGREKPEPNAGDVAYWQQLFSRNQKLRKKKGER